VRSNNLCFPMAMVQARSKKSGRLANTRHKLSACGMMFNYSCNALNYSRFKCIVLYFFAS
jgi:hypothetical protein